MGTEFLNGLRSGVVQTDTGDIVNWAEKTTNFDSTGQLTHTVTVYDDGRTMEVDYIDGVRSTGLLTDTADAFAWYTKAYTYDANGALQDVVVTHDPLNLN